MRNPQKVLALYEHVSCDHQIRMLRHGSGKRVLNRNDGGLHRSRLNAVKYFHRPRTGHNGAARQHLLSGFVAERTALPLDSHFHLELSRQRTV